MSVGPPPSYGQATTGFAPPMQGYAPPMQGFSPPMQGYAPPMQGYAPPVTSFGPPSPQSGMPASPNNVTVVTVQPPNPKPPDQPPPDYTRLAYISCLFCPLVASGAIRAARQSRDSYRAGDYEKAFHLSQSARVKSISAICGGIFITIILLVMYSQDIYKMYFY